MEEILNVKRGRLDLKVGDQKVEFIRTYILKLSSQV